ncbi:preprotein translocase subunit SecG [Planctomycetes bacterium Poly30]|uniref:Protein-export membrane protein SecG n=1 Tax=Saltatorellus ferox TaxID=2528018 RepID=A0A518F079_9BACT|nr:preprotein translocase subunit SecG [Planctomycetes bacterium Poly30]
MSTTIVLLYILFVAAAIILTVVILLQEGKGGGFGDALGAAGQQAFGVKASGVQKFTMYVAIAFLGSAVLIHVLNNKRQSGVDIGGMESLDLGGSGADSSAVPIQIPAEEGK